MIAVPIGVVVAVALAVLVLAALVWRALWEFALLAEDRREGD